MKVDARFRERVDALIKKGEALLGTERFTESGGTRGVDSQQDAEWRSQARVCLEQLFGREHSYTESFASETLSSGSGYAVKGGLGVLQAALEDVELGHLDTVRQMATAEVFSDFIGQADYLLEHGHHIPAASLAGAVLENGLRSLAEKNDIATKPRDDLSALNNKLGAKSVYNRLRQKQVGYWADVRNHADHGNFDDFTQHDAAELVRGVRDFMAEYA